MAGMIITKDNFEQEVLNADKPVLIDFWAAWCGPCRMMSPIFDELVQEHPEVKMGKINIDEQPELAQKYGVMSIPTLVLFENGQVKDTSVGVVPKEKIEMMIK